MKNSMTFTTVKVVITNSNKDRSQKNINFLISIHDSSDDLGIPLQLGSQLGLRPNT